MDSSEEILETFLNGNRKDAVLRLEKSDILMSDFIRYLAEVLAPEEIIDVLITIALITER